MCVRVCGFVFGHLLVLFLCFVLFFDKGGGEEGSTHREN